MVAPRQENWEAARAGGTGVGSPALDSELVGSFPANRFRFLFPASESNHDIGPVQGKNGNYIIGGLEYASASEAVCGIMLKRYVPDFRVIQGETFQVPIGTSLRGNTLYADFQVDGVIVEFHPPRVWRPGNACGDFSSRSERRSYQKEMRKGNARDRKELKAATIEKLGEEYFATRRRILDESPEYRHKPLVVAVSDAEFYDKVICVFSDEAPDRESFLKEFAELRREIFEASKAHEKAERKQRKQRKIA